MTATLAVLTFADIPGGRAWLRVDDVWDPREHTHTPAPFLHYDLDCRWPASENGLVVTRGGADIVTAQPYFDHCDAWGLSDCPDAPDHRRVVPVCPRCAPALTGRSS